ncbi:MAG TPA: ATP-binding protein, partial [Waddliaceae bacterium]
INMIVEMTFGMSGAFIESLVMGATNCSLQRICEQNISPENISAHPSAKICQQDFLDAYSTLFGKNKFEIQTFTQHGRIDVKGVSESLKSLGLGGIPSEAVQFLSDLKIYHKYKDHTAAYPFFKGLFLYGPPGTGKTRFAKAIKTLFSLQGNQFQYIQFSNLWPLQGVHLKNQIEILLKPALTASKDSKHEAPLHVIVIDELGGLYKKEADPELFPLNKFMSELQPFFEEQDQLRNLLLIGISRDSLLTTHNSFQRQGLCKHIEMGIPTNEAREEILEIYLRRFIKNKQLVVPIEELANITTEYTGAQIEGWITETLTIALRRVAQANLQTADLRLTKKDFQEAASLGRKVKKSDMFT